MIELIQIGHSRKAKGIEGSFRVHVEDSYVEDLKKARALFVSLDGSEVPFIIESVSDQKSILLKLEGIDNPEDVQPLLGNEIFLHTDEVSEKEGLQAHHPLTGYNVIDQDDQVIGRIEELLEYPDQLLAKILIEQKEVLLPIHEDLILQLNEDEQWIQISIAEGLLNL